MKFIFQQECQTVITGVIYIPCYLYLHMSARDHNKLQKILKEMAIADHLTCLLRNFYAGQEATVKTRHDNDWFQIGKGVCKGCILSPSYLTAVQSTSHEVLN